MPHATPGADEAYRAVLERLQAGVFQPGSRLPGERALSVQVGVSRATLRAALVQLAGEGRLRASTKRGWFVRDDAVGEPPNTLQSFTEMAAARGVSAQSRILSLAVRPSTFEEAVELGIVPTADVVALERVRSMDHVPLCVDRSVLPAARVPGLADDDLEDLSMYDHLQRRFGLHVVRSTYTLSAALLDAATAALLAAPVASAAFVAHETTYDANDVPVLLARLTYRGDAYRFKANLYRP